MRSRDGQHPDAWLEGQDFTGVRALAFGKDQNAVAVRGKVARIAQRFARARFALRKWKGVEHQRRETVVQAVGETLAPAGNARG